MAEVSDTALIAAAESVLNSQELHDFYVADVGCALVSDNNKIFTGVCIGGSLGICAEQSAMSNLLSVSGPKIKKIVAVWKDEEGELFVLPPCGRCREFLRLMSPENLEVSVILGKDHAAPLKDLLPFYGWHAEKALQT